MQTLKDFITLADPNVLYVLLGMFFIHSSSALIGTYAFLRKRALIGDAVAHSLLPGLCLGFMLSGEKNMTYLLLGAFLTGWMSTFLVDFIVNNSKVKQDTAIGIVLSFFFGFGVVLLTYIQKYGGGKQAGLDHFLFGQAAAINKGDLWIFAVIFAIILLSVIIFHQLFKTICFNRDYAQAIGLPVRLLEFIITSLTVLSIAAGIQALGVVLMSALIITPAASARFWTHKLGVILLLSVIFSVFSGITGAYVSYAWSGMPTGPWVVLVLSIITVISVFFSPGRGVLAKFSRSARNAKKIREENILKAIYIFHESQGLQKALDREVSTVDLIELRNFDTSDLQKGINRLIKKGFLEKSNGKYQLTAAGKKESKRIVRLHRLWEQYLLKRTSIDTDHVHSGAEVIEHIITPEIERELEKDLGIEGIPEEDY